MFESKVVFRLLTFSAAAALICAPVAMAGNVETSATSATNATATPAAFQPAAGAGLWTAVASSGLVESRGPNPMFSGWEKVSRGMSFDPLSVVKTGKRGRTTLTREGSVILVAAGSELILPAGPNEHSENTLVRQTSGSAVYDIAPWDSGRFTVETPFLVAGVKGTVFSIIVDNGFTAVSVNEGTVEINPFGSDRAVDLHAGDMALMNGRGSEFEVIRNTAGDQGVNDPARLRVARKMSRRLSMQAERERDRMERNGDLLDDGRFDREGDGPGSMNEKGKGNDDNLDAKKERFRDDEDDDDDNQVGPTTPSGKKGKGTPNQP